jgi:hypothetical protein
MGVDVVPVSPPIVLTEMNLHIAAIIPSVQPDQCVEIVRPCIGIRCAGGDDAKRPVVEGVKERCGRELFPEAAEGCLR